MKRFLRIKHSNSNRQSGATFVEFAIGFPLLALLILFLIDAGLYLFQKAIVTNATAVLNREIATELGQREAAASFCSTAPLGTLGCAGVAAPDCNALEGIALAKKGTISNDKEILFENIEFDFQISSDPNTLFRLISTQGNKDFICLSCKFIPAITAGITHTSVLVIERPPYIPASGNLCTSHTFSTNYN